MNRQQRRARERKQRRQHGPEVLGMPILETNAPTLDLGITHVCNPDDAPEGPLYLMGRKYVTQADDCWQQATRHDCGCRYMVSLTLVEQPLDELSDEQRHRLFRFAAWHGDTIQEALI